MRKYLFSLALLLYCHISFGYFKNVFDYKDTAFERKTKEQAQKAYGGSLNDEELKRAVSYLKKIEEDKYIKYVDSSVKEIPDTLFQKMVNLESITDTIEKNNVIGKGYMDLAFMWDKTFLELTPNFKSQVFRLADGNIDKFPMIAMQIVHEHLKAYKRQPNVFTNWLIYDAWKIIITILGVLLGASLINNLWRRITKKLAKIR